MEVQFSQELETKVNRVAAENHSPAQEYVKQLVERYVDHDAWFRERVRQSLKRVNGGGFLTHEEMGQRIEQMFRP